MSSQNPIEFAVIQAGHCVFGVGSTADEAYEDAASALEDGYDADRVEAECVSRPNDGDLTLIERDDDVDLFDGYLRNQGAYTLRDGQWFNV